MKVFLLIYVVIASCLLVQTLQVARKEIRDLKIELAIQAKALDRCRVECSVYEPRPLLESEKGVIVR